MSTQPQIGSTSPTSEATRLKRDELVGGLAFYALVCAAASAGDRWVPPTTATPWPLVAALTAGVVGAAGGALVVQAYSWFSGRSRASFGLRLGVTWAGTALFLNGIIQAAAGFAWPGLDATRIGSLVLCQLVGWSAFLFGSWAAASRCE